MAADEKKMTDEEMALSRFEMDGVTVNGDVEGAAKRLREYFETLRKEDKLKERKGR